MSERALPSSVGQRTIFMFLTKLKRQKHEGTKPIEVLEILRLQFRNETSSRTQTFAWRKLFFSERQNIENTSQPQRLKTSVKPANIVKLLGN